LIVRQRNRVACLIVPNLEVHDLRSTDADRDSQHFRTRHPLAESGVKASASLLDKRKVKSSRVGDSLDVVWIEKVVLGCGNCRMLPNSQTGDCLRKRRTQIGIFFAAIPSPPSCVHAKLLEICEPPGLLDAWHFARR